jgi:hypothetical protein
MYQLYVEQSTNDRTKTALKVREFTAGCLEMCWFMVVSNKLSLLQRQMMYLLY